MWGRFKDLTGLRFDKLIVIQLVENVNPPKWLCICDCGKEVIISTSNLKKQHSCGCLNLISRIKDLTGKRFGRLVVIKFYEIKNKRTYWSCLCDCKRNTIVRGDGLVSGHIKGCGCLMGKHSIKHGMSYTYLYHMYSTVKSRAKKNKLSFNLELQDLPEVPEFCPILGIPLQIGKNGTFDNSPSIDKIIPELGYVKGNIKIISHRANRIKNCGTEEEHIKIAEYIKINTRKEQ